MSLFLNWRVWVALALAGAFALTGWKAYKFGAESVQVKFDAYKNQQVLDSLAAEKAAREKEQGMQTSLENLTNAYIAQKSSLAAAHTVNGKLLDGFNTALNSPSPQDSTTTSGADAGTRLEQELLGSCAATLVKLAEEADGLEAKVVGLQEYVRGVVKP